jgi:hypothetical protein
MQCPKCGLENPPSAETCDCGYSLGSGIQDCPAPKRAGRLSWRRGLAAATVLALACAAAAAVMWLRENPHFFMVKALHAGMSPKDVIDALGEPCGNLSKRSLLSWLLARSLYKEYIGDPILRLKQGQ